MHEELAECTTMQQTGWRTMMNDLNANCSKHWAGAGVGGIK